MKSLLIIEIWKYKWSAFAALSTMFTVFFWPALPLRGILNWLQFFYYYSPQNILYALLTLLAGLYVGIYVYDKKVCTTCTIRTTKTGTVGIFGGILLGVCPACIPVLAFFLPLGISIYLSSISWVFLTTTIILITFLIYRMDGFKRI